MSDAPMAAGGRKERRKPWSHPDRHWEVRDAMHTMIRAGEIVRDKKLLVEVKKHAAEHADKMKEVARQAAELAKRGRISPKQMAKLGKH